MDKSHRTLKTLFAGGISLFLFSGCATTAENSATTVSENNSNDNQSSALDAANTTPLTEYLNLIHNLNADMTEQQRQWEADNLRREEIVAQCMNERGFEYKPNLPDNHTSTLFAEQNNEDRNSSEWISQYGYGIVRDLFNDENFNNNPHVDSMSNIGDPNNDYVNSLSESEQQAYYIALWGPPFEADADGNYPEWNSTTAGCWGYAQAQVSNDEYQVWQLAEFAPLFDALNQMQNDMWFNPEFAVLDNEWSVCMVDKGFPNVAKQSDAQMNFMDEAGEFWNYWHGNAVNAFGEDYTSEQLNNFMGFADARRELQEQEIKLASADFECREQVDLRNRQDAIIYEIESQFIEEHKAELEALRAFLEQN